MGKKSINVWCPASIALKNDSSIYFDTENGFSLGPGKHKNAKKFISVTSHALYPLPLSQTVTPSRTPPLERDVLYGRSLSIFATRWAY